MVDVPVKNMVEGGLVERLRETHTCDGCGEYVGSQVTALLDEAATALTSERAAHAETKRERDELKADIDSYAEASSNLATELSETETRLAEAKKALEWYGEQARLARLIHSEGDKGRHALAADGGKLARRVLEGE